MKERLSISEVILGVLGLSALLTVAFIAPNAVQIIDIFGRRRIYPRRQFRTALKRLEKKGLIRCTSEDTSWKYKLTNNGKKILEEKNIEKSKLKKPKKWDGIWRIVIFDIPEKKRIERDSLRWKLIDWGFKYLNLSVWVYPYPCRDELNALVKLHDIGEYVRYMESTVFDGSDEMKKKFNLS